MVSPARARLGAQALLRTAYAEAGRYIAGYNIWMHHLVDASGQRLFPPGKRLLSHWNLRDELKANYADKKDGLAKQRTIQRVMERIVAQDIPAIVIDNPAVDWNPFTNAVTRSAVNDVPAGATAPMLRCHRRSDRCSARARRALRAPAGQLPCAAAGRPLLPRAEHADPAVLRTVTGSSPSSACRPCWSRCWVRRRSRARRSSSRKRLGRKLEPFDIWYNGFRAGGSQDEAQLDALVAQQYPDAAAYQRDIPNLLRSLGFAADRADYVAQHIVVDPARGSGHAMGAQMRGEPAHLRTRVERGGMNYKGYNIAVHEMCHNVEQTFSLYDVDYYTLHGVPNTAFTEALAFTCQNRDLELLGLGEPDAQSRALEALDTFWGTYEIGGVALVDMQAWRWMYAHPHATAAELREAVLAIARDTWNHWYAPVFGVRDVTLLGVYSHMINEILYLPDYPIGHMIAFQVEAQMEKAGNFGAEFERVARIGAVAPDLWMTQATGAPVGPEALLAAAQKALDAL